jgi:hypothetical protein
MRLIIAVIFFFAFTISSDLAAQSITDTLQLDSLKQLRKLSDIYTLPGGQYQLDHFLAFIYLPDIEPYAVFNKGNDFIPELVETISKMKGESKFSIQVFALNTDKPDPKPMKFPRKDFYIK